jgi:hypothetical protein
MIAGFERIFLNMGNPTSVLAWLFLLLPNRRQFHQPAIEHRREPSGSSLPAGARA